jgi:hypothetical protein
VFQYLFERLDGHAGIVSQSHSLNTGARAANTEISYWSWLHSNKKTSWPGQARS